MEYNIQQVDQIHEVVQTEPNEQSITGDFRKTKAENDDPKVVQKGKGYHHGPIITQPASRVEHKRQIASAKQIRKIRWAQCQIFWKLPIQKYIFFLFPILLSHSLFFSYPFFQHLHSVKIYELLPILK